MSKPSVLLKTSTKYVAAAILIAVPLLQKFPFIKVPGTFVAIRLEDIILALSGILVFFLYFPTRKKFVKDSLNKAVVLFLLVGLVSLFSAILVTHTVSPHIGILHWARRVEYFIPFFLGLAAIKYNRKNLSFFIKILLLVVFFVFIYGFGQKHFGWPIIITQNEEYSKGVALSYIPGGHINSTFAGHYDLGTFLVLVLPIMISAIFLVDRFFNKAVFATVSLMGLWLMANTASRISLVSYLMSVFLALVLVKKFKALIFVLVISLFFASFSTSLVSRYERIFEFATDKMEQFNLINYVNKPVFAAESTSLPQKRSKEATPTPTPVFEDRSTNIRLNVEWPRALRALTKNPLLGTGYSSITLATDNDYLRFLGEVGLMGFFAFMLLIVRIIIKFLEKFPFTNNFKGLELAFIAGSASAIPGILLNTFFIDVFEASKFAIIFWLFIGFSIGLLDKIKYVHKA